MHVPHIRFSFAAPIHHPLPPLADSIITTAYVPLGRLPIVTDNMGAIAPAGIHAAFFKALDFLPIAKNSDTITKPRRGFVMVQRPRKSR
jgi:hypothetical protein